MTVLEAYGDRHFDLISQRVCFLVEKAPPVIFGAGQNGRQILNLLRSRGIEPCVFADDTPSKIGTLIGGVKVCSTQDAISNYKSAVFIVSIFHPSHDYSSTRSRLALANVLTISIFEFYLVYGADNLPFYFIDKSSAILENAESILALADSMVDDYSIDLLCRHLEFRLSLRTDIIYSWTPKRIPPPAHSNSWTYIDVGAFDGDTLIPFYRENAALLQKAIAIEPDRDNFERLKKNVESVGEPLSQISSLLCLAVDRVSGQRFFQSTSTLASAFDAAGNERVSTVSIDDLVRDLDIKNSVYIKLDVEGFESEAIFGGRETIARIDTLVSVALYHKPSDIWLLPDLLSEIQGKSRFMLRCHGGDGADLMLYALPRS